MVGDAIKSILSGITANVNPSLIPNNRASQWIIYHQISRIPTNTKTDGGHYDLYRFQLDIYGRTYQDTDSLAYLVKQALDEYSGTVGATLVDHIYFENETDSWEDIEEEHYYRKIQDYMIFIKDPDVLFISQYLSVYNSFKTKPTIADGLIQNTLLNTLYTNGIYAKCELIDIFSTHSNDKLEAYKNWKSPGTFDPSPVNSPVWTQYAGITGNSAGGKCIKLNFNPASDGTLIGQDNICVIIGIGDNVSEDITDFGGWDGNDYLAIYSRDILDILTGYCNSDVTGGLEANTNSKKHFAISRNNADNFDLYQNLSKTNEVDPSTGTVNVDLYACGCNNNGTIVANNKTLRYVIIASYLTQAEITIAINALETYLDNYGKGLIT